MSSQEAFADVLMLAHAFYSVFVVFGFVLILLGVALGWQWSTNRWFRAFHLAATVAVVARVWIGFPCPFSAAEDVLRSQTVAACPLGRQFHDAFHGLAFRGQDPHEFAISTSVLGAFVAAIFILNLKPSVVRSDGHGRQP